MNSFLQACAFTSSSFLITDFLDTDQTAAFNSLTQIYDGLTSYASYKTTYYDSSYTTPTTISTYYAALSTYSDFSVDDYANVNANDSPSQV